MPLIENSGKDEGKLFNEGRVNKLRSRRNMNGKKNKHKERSCTNTKADQ